MLDSPKPNLGCVFTRITRKAGTLPTRSTSPTRSSHSGKRCFSSGRSTRHWYTVSPGSYGTKALLTDPGSFIPLDEKNEKTYSYIRHDKTIDQKLLVVLNFSRSGPDSEGYYHGEKSAVELPKDLDVSNAKLIVTNGEAKEDSGIEGSKIELSEWEGRIYLL
jgi:hypothetical protein